MKTTAIKDTKQVPQPTAPSRLATTTPFHTVTHREQLPLQKKLTINSAGDRYEVEADRVAEQVMGMTEPRLQRRALGSTPTVQRQSEAVVADQVPLPVQQALNSRGQPLDAATRAFIEPRFGHDFARVRVYADDRAAESARALNALAYTVAPNIVFGAGQYAPQTDAGRSLLAHELTHVAQQATGLQTFIQRQEDKEQVCQAPKAGDIFLLDNTAVWNPAERTTASIRRRTQGPLSAEQYKVGDWLDDEWEIVEISYQYIVVINATCGTEETLQFERGELTPELSVGLSETNFGAGVVRIYDNSKRVVFEPSDESKPPREYRLETLRKEGHAPLTVYVLQSGERTFYPPSDLEGMLRLHLVGEKRGAPKPKPEIAEETWEDFTTSGP